MPNHITNHIKSSAEVIAALNGAPSDDGSERHVDFAAIVPVPDALFCGDLPGDAESLAKMICGLIDRTDMLGQLEMSNAVRGLQRGGVVALSDESFDAFVKMVTSMRSCGFMSWYDWNIKHWGTKWNAYDIKLVAPGHVQFDTAWSAPQPVIDALVAKFPSARIEHLWADEDIGRNLGHRIYQDGDIQEIAVADPIAFALDTKGLGREGYVVSPATGLLEMEGEE